MSKLTFQSPASPLDLVLPTLLGLSNHCKYTLLPFLGGMGEKGGVRYFSCLLYSGYPKYNNLDFSTIGSEVILFLQPSCKSQLKKFLFCGSFPIF